MTRNSILTAPRKDNFDAGRVDSSLDPVLNGVMVDGERIAWARAFPRPEYDNPEYWAATRPEGVHHAGVR